MFKSRNTNSAQQCSVSRSLYYTSLCAIFHQSPFYMPYVSRICWHTPFGAKVDPYPLLKNEVVRHVLLIICIIACRRARGTDVLLRSLRSHAKSFKTEPAEEMHWRLGRTEAARKNAWPECTHCACKVRWKMYKRDLNSEHLRKLQTLNPRFMCSRNPRETIISEFWISYICEPRPFSFPFKHVHDNINELHWWIYMFLLYYLTHLNPRCAFFFLM